MYCKTYSTSLQGLSGNLLEIECYVSGGLPSFTIIGVPSSSGNDTRERVRSALKQLGVSLPPSRVTINVRALNVHTILSESIPWLDLPIALCILACEGLIPGRTLASSVWLGELALSGELKPLYGALSMARSMEDLSSPFEETPVPFFLPEINAPEAAFSPLVSVYGLLSLEDAVSYLRHQKDLSPTLPNAQPQTVPSSLFDKVYGQGIAKRVITIAAAGNHNLLMIGPPGCGKTMLAQTLPSLLPPMDLSEQLEVTEIYSAKQMLENNASLVTMRPFRSPHHSISVPSLIGGGRIPIPGEISLAHHGVLFLDELPELSRSALEALREPLESHEIHISRVHSSFRFPADMLFVGGMNPCPCGHYPDRTRCHCSDRMVKEYFGKIDSPLLDRMDLILPMESVKPEEIEQNVGLTYQEARALVQRARDMQAERYASPSHTNSRINADEIEKFCQISPEDQRFLKGAISHFHLSMRAYHKLLRVSRTIADMEGSELIRRPHILEALQYRTARIEMPE